MSEDVRQMITVFTALIVVVALGIVGGLRCEQQRQSFHLDCIKAGKSASECIALRHGAGN